MFSYALKVCIQKISNKILAGVDNLKLGVFFHKSIIFHSIRTPLNRHFSFLKSFQKVTSMSAFSDPDQPARFAAQKAADDSRALRIEEHYQPGRLAGQRILITGANRGIGWSLVKEAVLAGARVVATCRKTNDALNAAGVEQIIEGIDVTSDIASRFKMFLVTLYNTQFLL